MTEKNCIFFPEKVISQFPNELVDKRLPASISATEFT